ncbi:alpha-2-macroglobulin-like protein 1 [Oryzias latipes]|uniref:Alpha-2-macroglobulin-like n=1 Tax=Oryzias latipes TaxID=8090 RepID=H2M249_ORYLA|nr:alpha-2-macroglobulin-like protein 1 [Oryzias latipes]
MGHSGIQTLTWTLCVLLCKISQGDAQEEIQYVVAVPGVIESGTEAKFCASLLELNQAVVMTVVLKSKEKNTTLLERTSDKKFHECTEFQAPTVQNEEVHILEVSVQSNTFYSKKSQKIMIKAFQPKPFVQTDKPIYLPGQMVNFRVFALDSKLRPASLLFNVIELQDPHGNRIGQWLNETSDGKILALSYSLSSEAREGVHQIVLSVGDDKISHSFKVEKYVLPKFEVTLNVKEEVSIGQEEITAEVCAKYTFGQPVPGTISVKMCRPSQPFYYGVTVKKEDGSPVITEPCVGKIKQTDKSGCTTLEFSMSTFTRMDAKILRDELKVEALVEEEGTEISLGQAKTIQLSYVIGKLSFTDTPKLYNQNSTLEGKVKAVYYNDTPIAGMQLHVLSGRMWSPEEQAIVTTDINGTAPFSISTRSFVGTINLHVSDKPSLDHSRYREVFYQLGSHTINVATPPSPDAVTASSLEIKREASLSCNKNEEIIIQYTLVREAQGSVDVVYLVLSKQSIYMQGHKTIQVHDVPVNQGEVSFTLDVSPDMAPTVQIVVYAILPSQEFIAHYVSLSTGDCFKNEVSVEFSPSSAVPGEEAEMQLTAHPDSLCGVSAIDQSVLIKEPGGTLDADKIYNLLPLRRTYIPYEIQEVPECLPVRPKRYISPDYIHPPNIGQSDAYSMFQNAGLKVATNLILQVPTCLKFKGRMYHTGMAGGIGLYRDGLNGPPLMSRMGAPPGLPGAVGAAPEAMASVAYDYDAGPEPVETVRTFFPETWIWDLVEVGESGKKTVAHTVPDTITTWETETFCLSSQGFGLAPRQKITVFQPFFLELTLPYSIIRGENFELKATVFNYLSSCIMVEVTPTPSSDYTLTALSSDQYTSCLCGNERKTLRWNLASIALGVMNVTVSAEAVPSHASCDNEIVKVPERGRIDKVTKSLIVKAEGVEVTKAYNWLLCPNGNTLTETTEIQLPDNVIEGSARGTVSVLGDILGRALKNLDGLLQMPYGCGEQNMALLAPDIYILHYLKSTKQLTPEINEKVSQFLKSGYQRQLNYKDSEGAYTTFGSGPGNTWLTAFVLRSFYKAQSFIYIDEEKIKESRRWLEGKQMQNGCFEQSGKLFNNRMKGGVSDEVTLSAYITAAFLEMKISPNDHVLNKSLLCLKSSLSDLSNTYTTALLAYVFTLAEDMETRDHLLKQLDNSAIREGGFLHWSQTGTEKSDSLSVEITSYVLMAKLGASPTSEDLGYASSIVRWLSGQQNYYGGFSSTQDTVVALQALALYSSLVFTPGGSSTVTLQSPSGQLTFHVNPDNKLLYQESVLQKMTGSYNLEVKGSACASVQISLFYNIPTPQETNTLSIKVLPEADLSTKKPRVILKLNSLYTGKETNTNMVIIDITILSGFVPNVKSLDSIKKAPLVDRVEHKDGHVLVYLRELVKELPMNYSLVLEQQHVVQNLKPAVVTLYDYYQPSERAEAEYTFQN